MNQVMIRTMIRTICVLLIISQGDAQQSTSTADVVFIGSGDSMVTKCASSASITWFYKTWTEGSIRDYYVNKGFKNSLDECVQACMLQEECYFATLTASKTCYFLTTTPNVETVVCRFMNEGHYGTPGETCDLFHPCPSAYKICGRCQLDEVLISYCKNKDKDAAVSKCPAPTTTGTTTATGTSTGTGTSTDTTTTISTTTGAGIGTGTCTLVCTGTGTDTTTTTATTTTTGTGIGTGTDTTTTTGTTTVTTPTTTSVISTTSAKPHDVVFVGSGDSMVTKCSSTASITWVYMTWTVGSIRGYYVNKGFKWTLAECVQECALQPECFFATMTASNTCYLLTTAPNIDTVVCRYENGGHYGPTVFLGDCTSLFPCPSAYKVCGKCRLDDVIISYCKNGTKNEC